jgi:hypothetical protein
MPEGAAHDPSGFVAGLGRGLLWRSRYVAILERNDGEEWREFARFGTEREADRALDDVIGDGGAPGSLRVVKAYAVPEGALVIAGTIAIAAAITIILFIIFG